MIDSHMAMAPAFYQTITRQTLILSTYGGFEFLVDAMLVVLSGALAYLVYEREFAHRKASNANHAQTQPPNADLQTRFSNASEVEKVRAKAAAEVMKPMDLSTAGGLGTAGGRETAGGRAAAGGMGFEKASVRESPASNASKVREATPADRTSIRERARAEIKASERLKKGAHDELVMAKKKYMKHEITFAKLKQDTKELEARTAQEEKKIRALKKIEEDNK